MDPLEAIIWQRNQRYEVWDKLTDRLAKIGEDNRRKKFTQAAMSAIPDDAPMTYDVFTNLTQQYPSMDPMEAFQIVGGIAKLKTADRVKRVVRALNETRLDGDIERKATAETLYRNNADIWPEVANILKAGQAQYVERNPDRDRYKIDPMTGEESLVGRAREREKDASAPQWRVRYDQILPEVGGDPRKAMEWLEIEKNFPIGKEQTTKLRDENGEVREIQKTVTGYDPKTHKPIFEETDITEDFALKRELEWVNKARVDRGEKPIPPDQYLPWKRSMMERMMVETSLPTGRFEASGSQTTRTWNPTKGTFE